MPTDDANASPPESPSGELNINGKRPSDDGHDEQPAKRRASNERMVASQLSQSLPVTSIEEQYAGHTSSQERDINESPHKPTPPLPPQQQPQKYHSTYMTNPYPPVNFPPSMLRRTYFHIAVASNPTGHSYQMNLAEAISANSFSNGVQRRLELLGYEIGEGMVMVADLFWIPTRSCLRELSDHDALMWQIWDWPGWRREEGEGGEGFLNVYLVLEGVMGKNVGEREGEGEGC